MYPEYAEIDGKEYKIDTDFKTALKCLEVAEDENITDYERTIAIIYLLFDFIPKKNIKKFLEKSMLFLQCGETLEEQEEKEKDMDFLQDRKYINASLMSDYHIDLSKANLHWWQFVELIQGLTENSSLSRIRNIRNMDLSDIKDEKTKNEVIKAKEYFALKEKHIKTDEEKEIDEFWENIVGKE